MTDLLNIDALLPEPDYVVFGGEKHEIKAGTVETWLKLMKLRQRVLALSDVQENLEGEQAEKAQEEMVELQIDIVAIALPSIPDKTIRQLPLDILMKITSVVGDVMSRRSGIATAEEGAEPGEAGKGSGKTDQ